MGLVTKTLRPGVVLWAYVTVAALIVLVLWVRP